MCFTLWGLPVNGYGNSINVNIHFYQKITVHKPVILLNQIAEISTNGPDSLLNILRNLSVGYSAPPSQLRYCMTNDLIQYIIKPRFPTLNISFQGPVRIEIKSSFSVVKLQNFNEQIRSHLDNQIKWDKGLYSITIDNLEDSVKIFDDFLIVQFSNLKETYPKGKFVTYLLLKQGNTKYTIPIKCKCVVRSPVVMSNCLIPRGTQIDASMIHIDTVDITHFSPKPFKSKDLLIGKRTSRTITNNEILYAQMLHEMPVISTGEISYLELNRGSLRIQVPVVARESGYIGQSIWAENSNSKKLVRVKILEKGKVQLL